MVSKISDSAGSIPAASTNNQLIPHGLWDQPTVQNRPEPPTLWHDQGTIPTPHSPAGQQVGGEWQPIESAPKDTRILVCGMKRLDYAIARLTDRDGWEAEAVHDWFSIYTPKFWKPLDPLPCKSWFDREPVGPSASELCQPSGYGLATVLDGESPDDPSMPAVST